MFGHVLEKCCGDSLPRRETARRPRALEIVDSSLVSQNSNEFLESIPVQVQAKVEELEAKLERARERNAALVSEKMALLEKHADHMMRTADDSRR